MTGVSRGPAASAQIALALVATPGLAARADALARTLPGLVAPGTEARVHAVSDGALAVQGATIAVLLLHARDVPDGLSELLDAAEEARIGVITLVDGHVAVSAGAGTPTGEAASSDDATVAALVRGMLARQHEVDRLTRELSIATRFTSGLRGEIARMQEELQLAAQVQREFLPRSLPAIGSVRVDAFWRPASYVSGDIYDVVRLDERHIGVFLADAVGHGVPAALLTMVICRGLPTKDVGHGTYRLIPPGEALARINADMLAHQGRTTRFATAVYAVIDTESGACRLASAGHPPPVVLRADGALDPVDCGGGLLGVFEGEEYPEVEFTLGPGDRLLIHSDGFEQAFPGDPSGTRQARLPSKRYLDEFAAVRGAPDASSLVQQIGRRIDMQFGSVHQADDITLLAVERLAGGAGT